MRMLAIGGSGFIGRFAVTALEEMGAEVIVFHRGERSTTASGEILGDRRQLARYTAKLREAKADVVIDFLISNGRQAAELLKVFGESVSRFVMVSSCDVYRAVGILHGTNPGEPDAATITEDSPLRTKLHPYPPDALKAVRAVYPWLEDDYDKIPAERVVLEAGGTILRLPMIYGPGDPLHRCFPVIKRVDDGRVVMVMGESTAQWRGIRGYVEDVAWAVALATTDKRAAGRVYNAGDPENLTELEWRRQIAEAAGGMVRFVVVPDEGAPADLKIRGNLRQHWIVDTIERFETFLDKVHKTCAKDREENFTVIEKAHVSPPFDPLLCCRTNASRIF